MYQKETLLFESGGRSHFRIPSVVATKNGTVIAFCNDRRDTVDDEASEVTLSCAIKKPGEDWSEVKTLVGIPGWACGMGSAVYDDITDTVFCTFGRSPVTKNEFAKLSEEESKELQRRAEEAIAASGVKPGTFILVSTDNGETWQERPHSVEHRPFVRFDGEEVMIGGGCHGSSHGIRLRHGEHAGRLLCPSRVTVKEYHSWEGPQDLLTQQRDLQRRPRSHMACVRSGSGRHRRGHVDRAWRRYYHIQLARVFQGSEEIPCDEYGRRRDLGRLPMR